MIFDNPDYIQREIPSLDHVRRYRSTVTFINPPPISKGDFEGVKELKEIAEAKIEEFLQRYDEVEDRYRKNVGLIHKVYGGQSIQTLEFFLTIESYDATEVVYLKKWLKYWKRLYEGVTKEKVLTIDYPDNRFTEDQLSQARAVPIEDLYNGEFRVMGAKLVGSCPFHEEKTPSFTIFTNENNFHCFGCQEHGDAIAFYMKANGVDFVTAVKELLNE